MKVIATAYHQQRLVLDQVDAVTATMTASVLNGIEAKKDPKSREPRFYQVVPDEYELKGSN